MIEECGRWTGVDFLFWENRDAWFLAHLENNLIESGS